VTSLELNYLDLSDARLPASIGDMNALTVLNLNGRWMGRGQPLPSTLGNLLSLTRLDLTSNNFAGQLPTTLGNLRRLEYLKVNGNNFNGTLPSEIGSMSSLHWLEIGGNIGGTIPPQLFNAPLYWLQMTGPYTGTLPSEVGNLQRVRWSGSWTGQGWSTGLGYINIQSTSLSGAIPEAICNIPKNTQCFTMWYDSPGLTCYPPCLLTKGYKQWCGDGGPDRHLPACATTVVAPNPTASPVYSPTGAVAAVLNDQTALCDIYQGLNTKAKTDFFGSGYASVTFCSGSKNANGIYSTPPCSSNTNDYGTNPINGNWGGSWNGGYGELKCQLVGGVGRVVSLGMWSTSGTLSSLPTTIGLLDQLTQLNFDWGGGSIGGTIPTQMGLLTNLARLSLASSCSCAISTTATNCGALTGTIPTEISQLSSLQALDFSCMRATGLPSTLANTPMTALRITYVPGSGSWLSSICSFTKLQSLSLQSRYPGSSGGTIPSCIGALTKLYNLELDENRFTGTLPTAIGLLTNMGIEINNGLGLSGNSLSGSLPSELGLLRYNNLFGVRGNKFTGPVPASMCNWMGNGYRNMDFGVGSDNSFTCVPSCFSAGNGMWIGPYTQPCPYETTSVPATYYPTLSHSNGEVALPGTYLGMLAPLGNVFTVSVDVFPTATNPEMMQILQLTFDRVGYPNNRLWRFPGIYYCASYEKLDPSCPIRGVLASFSTGNRYSEAWVTSGTTSLPLNSWTTIKVTVDLLNDLMGLQLSGAASLAYKTIGISSNNLRDPYPAKLYAPDSYDFTQGHPFYVASEKYMNVYMRNIAIERSHGYYMASLLASGWDTPSGVGVDSAGNVYVASVQSGVIRKVSATGAVSVISTDGCVGCWYPYGMTTDAQGNMFVVNSQGAGVFRIDNTTGHSTQLTTKRVPQYAVAVSSAGGPVYTYKDENLYSIDQKSLTETIVYTSSNGFGCVAVDPSGMVYFAQGASIYKLVPSTQVATLLTLSGKTLTSVGMIRADGMGNLFVLGDNSLSKIVLSTGVVSNIVSTISFSMAIGLAVSNSGNLYVTDVWGNKVVMLALQ